jgi:hypothetical protein
MRPNGRGNGADHAAGEPQAEIGDIVAALALIPNDDRPWDGDGGWNTIGMATWRAAGGSAEGLAAFIDWSRKSSKFDLEETEFRWRHFAASPPGQIGFGTLVHLARMAQPDWVPPSRRARGDAPTIRLASGQRPAAVIAGMAALVDAELYRRDRQIVYVARVPARAADGRALQIPGIARVETPHLQHQLGRAAVWMRYDGRRRGWAQVDVPVEIATTIAALPNEWPFSAITGVIATPTMRPDGTMLTEAGYVRWPLAGVQLCAGISGQLILAYCRRRRTNRRRPAEQDWHDLAVEPHPLGCDVVSRQPGDTPIGQLDRLGGGIAWVVGPGLPPPGAQLLDDELRDAAHVVNAGVRLLHIVDMRRDVAPAVARSLHEDDPQKGPTSSYVCQRRNAPGSFGQRVATNRSGVRRSGTVMDAPRARCRAGDAARQPEHVRAFGGQPSRAAAILSRLQHAATWWPVCTDLGALVFPPALSQLCRTE